MARRLRLKLWRWLYRVHGRLHAEENYVLDALEFYPVEPFEEVV